MAAQSVRLGHLDDLPDGDSRGFDPFRAGQDTLLIVRRGRELYAWLNSCPHIGGTSLAWRKDAFLNAARDRIVCAAHGALFDIVSGRCDLGPCLGQSLTPLRVTLAEDEAIYLEFDGRHTHPLNGTESRQRFTACGQRENAPKRKIIDQ